MGKTSNTIMDLYSVKENSFHFLRFVFAAMVILSHSWALLYGEKSVDFLAKYTSNQISFGAIAVFGFMVISGFLVTQSFINSKNYFFYLIKRILRIFPAFLVSLVLIALFVGPFLTKLNLVSYFFSGSGQLSDNPFMFVFKNIIFNINGLYSWGIHDLFLNNPFPSGVNGSMWTLKHEFACYLILPILGYFLFFRHKLLLIGFTVLFVIINILKQKFGISAFDLPGDKFWVIGAFEYDSFFKLGSYFFIGMLMYVFSNKIIINKRLFLLSLMLLFISLKFGNVNILALLLLPYIVIYLAVNLPFSKFSKYGDYSYGMYIYAFPVMQMLVLFFKDKLEIFSFFVSSFLITLFVSFFSWKFIEKPCLGLKRNLK